MSSISCGGNSGNNGGLNADEDADTVIKTLELTIENTSLRIPVGATTLTESVTVTAKNSTGQRINDAQIIFIVTSKGTAELTPSIAQGVTDERGEIKLTLTASGSGTATFTAQNLQTQVSQNFLITDPAEIKAFRIIAPMTDPAITISGGTTPEDRVTVTVAANGITNVGFTTTKGTWLSTGSTSSTISVTSGIATDTLIASVSDTGLATVVVLDTENANNIDSISVAMTLPQSAATFISIQSDVNILPLSSGSTTFTTNIEATVRSDDMTGNIPVPDVAVIFTLTNMTGSGEFLSKSFGVTDLNGSVKTKFSSGTLNSGLQIVTVNSLVVANTTINDSIDISMAGSGGSVSSSHSSTVSIVPDNLAIYLLDMTSLVLDSNSIPVANVDIKLDVWPDSYRTGVYYDRNPDVNTFECAIYYSGPPISNEDLDEDLILDIFSPSLSEDTNQDNNLTPSASSAGNIPPLAITDSLGSVTYPLIYLTSLAHWIDVRARATTTIQGIETTHSVFFNLPALKADTDNCLVSDSPFNIVVTAAPGEIATILGAGIAADTKWTLPIFEGNNNATWNADTGSLEIIPPTLPATVNMAQYRVSASAASPSKYIDFITITSDPVACPVANCNPLTASIPVVVIVQ